MKENHRNPSVLGREWVRKAELASILGICTKTIVALQGEGLPFVRLGSRLNLYNLDAARAWLAKRTIQMSLPGRER